MMIQSMVVQFELWIEMLSIYNWVSLLILPSSSQLLTPYLLLVEVLRKWCAEVRRDAGTQCSWMCSSVPDLIEWCSSFAGLSQNRVVFVEFSLQSHRLSSSVVCFFEFSKGGVCTLVTTMISPRSAIKQ
jgi:hypothetical protein